MKDGHTTKSESSFGKKLWCVLIVVFLGGIGWQVWKLHLYNNAVREAKEAGMHWDCDDTFSLIRQDWRNALKKETWGAHERRLTLGSVPDLARYRDLFHRLRPTVLQANDFIDESLDAIKNLTSLQELHLSRCPALQNLNALDGLKSLHELDLYACDALQNVDGIKGLTGLRALGLSHCPILQDVSSIKGLTSLQVLDLSEGTALKNLKVIKELTNIHELVLFRCAALQNLNGLKNLATLQEIDLCACNALQNVDGLKGLTGLQTLDLSGCDKIPAAALRELRAALPNTDITFPDGSNNPPQLESAP